MTSLTPGSAEGGRLAVTPSRRGWRVAAYVVFLPGEGGAVALERTPPDGLPTSNVPVPAEAPVGEAVYVGVFGTPADFDRSLHVSGVRVFATSTADVTIVPHVCHGGSVSVTTTPDSFCRTFGPTEDATL